LRRFFCAAHIDSAAADSAAFPSPAYDSTDDSRWPSPIHGKTLSIKNDPRAYFSHQNRTQKNRFKNRNKKLFAQVFFIAKKRARQIII
jgi:hypothetical protein